MRHKKILLFVLTIPAWLCAGEWSPRHTSPLDLVSVPGKPKLVLDNHGLRKWIEQLNANNASVLERSTAARMLAGYEDPSAVQALATNLALRGTTDTEQLHIACAQALTWVAANKNPVAAEALFQTVTASHYWLDGHRAVARAILDSQGGEAIIKALSAYLVRSKGPIPIKEDYDLNWAWGAFKDRMNVCHFKSSVAQEQAFDKELEFIWTELEKMSDGQLYLSLKDGHDMLAEWSYASPRAAEHLDRFVRLVYKRNAAIQVLAIDALIFQPPIVRHRAPRFHANTLVLLDQMSKGLPKRQKELVEALVRVACNGHHEEIIGRKASLSDIAIQVIEGHIPVLKNGIQAVDAQGQGKSASFSLPTAEQIRGDIACTQLGIAAIGDAGVRSWLLRTAQSPEIPLYIRLGAAEALVRVVRRKAGDDPERQSVCQALHAIMNEVPVGKDEASLRRRQRASMAWMQVVPRGEWPSALPEAKAYLKADVVYYSQILATLSEQIDVEDRANFSLAEAIVLLYEETYPLSPPPRTWKQILNASIRTRLNMSPEILPGEWPVDQSQWIPEKHTRYVPPAEWRAWLERYKKLPVFTKPAKSPGPKPNLTDE